MRGIEHLSELSKNRCSTSIEIERTLVSVDFSMGAKCSDGK